MREKKYKKLVKIQDELIRILKQKADILANNNSSEVMKFIGLTSLEIDLKEYIKQYKTKLGI
jgi:hypothetical protein